MFTRSPFPTRAREGARTPCCQPAPRQRRGRHALLLALVASLPTLAPAQSTAAWAGPQALDQSPGWQQALAGPADAAACSALLAAGPQARPLALAQAMALAACRSPELRRALAGIDLQRAALDEARAATAPLLSADLSLNASRNSGGLGSDGSVVSSGANSASLGLSARWVLFDFGLRAANRRQSGLALSAAEADRDAAALALASQVLRSYSEATVAEARAALRGQAHQVARRSLEVTRRLQDAGLSALPDRLRAEAVVAEQQFAWLRARGQARATRSALATLLGLPGLPAAALPQPAQVLPGRDEALDVQAWVDRALRVNPALRAADARWRAAAAASDSVRAAGRGALSLSAGVGQARIAELGTAGATPNRSERAALTLSVPLWDGGAGDARWQQAQARVRIEQANLDSAQLLIEQAVRREAQAWLAAREVTAAADQAVDLAEQAEAAARTRYSARAGTLTELLLAQRAVVDAELARLDNLADWSDVQWRLLAAAGQLQ